MNAKVYAVVVCYRPDEKLLKRCLDALEVQTDGVVCIDNTENNRGVAAALNEGFRKAVAEGAEWILSMDQDSILPPGAVQALLQCACQDSRIAQAGPRWNDEGSGDAGAYDTAFLITSGSLVRASAWLAAGPFREDYFIDLVDVEYSRRLRDKGFRVVCCPQVAMEHHLGEGPMGWNLFGKKRLCYIGHAPVRIYYMLRNALYFNREYKDAESGRLLRKLVRSLLRMLLQDPRRREIFRFARRAVKDYRAGITGPLT